MKSRVRDGPGRRPRSFIRHLLVRLLRGGSGVLVSTPYMDEAMRFNRVIFMNHGRALKQGPPRELMAGLSGQILELAAEPQMAARNVAIRDPNVEDVHSFGGYLHLRVHEPEEVMKRLPAQLKAAGVTVNHLRPVTPTLEDVFIQLLETEGEANGQPSPSA